MNKKTTDKCEHKSWFINQSSHCKDLLPTKGGIIFKNEKLKGAWTEKRQE